MHGLAYREVRPMAIPPSWKSISTANLQGITLGYFDTVPHKSGKHFCLDWGADYFRR